VLRSWLLPALLTPTVLLSLWGESCALYVGIAGDGFQARYFPPPAVELGPHQVRVLSTRQVVPGTGLPAGTVVQTANNNLDAVRHSDGRVYLAWRTAPDHFASTKTVLHVISSEDEQTWKLERKFATGSDLREPRLLSWQGTLYLYMAQLGRDPWAFEPHDVLFSEKRPGESFARPKSLGLSGSVVWRTRVEGGRPYMMAYRGGENIYQFNGKPLHVDMLSSEDGRSWQPLAAGKPSVYRGGGSEADFALDDRGALHAVIRNEAGDETGFGSKICSAPAEALHDWTCDSDSRKFDSPYVFKKDGEVYAIARRNISEDGRYEQPGPFQLFKAVRNQLNYITTGKRCALWRFAHEARRLSFVMDLPSRGDTCFPAVIDQAGTDKLVVYDYSSPTQGADPPWSVGQRKPTYIYRHELQFTRSQLSAAATEPARR
jgi:hypothetical protein